MFGFFKKKSGPDYTDIRELLFGDVPLSEWKAREGSGDSAEPWNNFESARAALGRGDSADAIAALRSW